MHGGEIPASSSVRGSFRFVYECWEMMPLAWIRHSVVVYVHLAKACWRSLRNA